MQTDPEFFIDTKYLPPKIPEGVYEGVFVRQEMAVVFKCPKIFVYFRITELGQYHGFELFRAYRVNAKSKPGKTPQMTLKPRSELLRMIQHVSGEKIRRDRASLSVLRGKILRLKVRTVTKDYRQRDLPEFDHYSVIEDITCID
jgi:hypothetical protein